MILVIPGHDTLMIPAVGLVKLIRNHLARSVNLPEGLYILLALIIYFFNISKAISGSTGPIFMIISANERYLREFSRFGHLF